MLSVASVRSASGAANYFAKDDYYIAEGSAEVSSWEGQGAQSLGLAGDVGKETFERLLKGELPSGEKVGQVENRAAGMDLTFSAPKSVSLMAYVGGDKRILGKDGAHMTAVRNTMAWVEKNLAEGRKDIDGKKVPIRTGNLVYAMFHHDTSRALDPQAHVHVVISNMTQMPDGKWQALHNRELWKNNTVIGSIYHSYLKNELEKLGYQVEDHGKHGTFEISGVPKEALEAFSQRRADILDKVKELGITTPEARNKVVIATRDPKLNVDDRGDLLAKWKETAASIGFKAEAIVARAMNSQNTPIGRGLQTITAAITAASDRLHDIIRPDDNLLDTKLERFLTSTGGVNAQYAVASAVRILGQREAAFPINKIAKTALDLGLKGVTIDNVSKRIDTLIESRRLIPGIIGRNDGTLTMATTRESLRTETRILCAVEDGRNQSIPIIAHEEAIARLQEASPHELNPGQLASAAMIVTSPDKIVVVQGVAGAGKSTMLQAVARVAEGQGKTMLGLASQNKMVNDLKEGANIETRTIASFIIENERFLTSRHSPDLATARDSYKNTVIAVDETSMVSSEDMLKLHQITDVLNIDKLVLVGDRQQLSSIDAGKAFALMQAGGVTMERMDQNIRQRTPTLRTVASLANVGKSSEALKVLGERVIESDAPAPHAAELWLSLSGEERDKTSVFASGREARGEINVRIQEGLIAEGTLSGKNISLTVYDRLNATREEMRYTSTYKSGQTLTAARNFPEIGLQRGEYQVTKVFTNGRIEVKHDGKAIRFKPRDLEIGKKLDRLELSIKKSLAVHEGDKIRWTVNDKERGLFNSGFAKIQSIDSTGVTVETAAGDRLTMPVNDPMLSRVDLAYSLNMHMAQGITTDKAIAVMSSTETNLSNQRLFNVAVTRVRDALNMVVDNIEKLSRQLDNSPGNKTSSLETTGKINVDRKPSGEIQQDKIDLPPPDPLPGDDIQTDNKELPPLPLEKSDKDHKEKYGRKEDKDTAPLGFDRNYDKAEILPLLPERSLGLDL